MIQNKNYGSSTMNEKFIELCDEFLRDFFESRRPNIEELRKEWIYFKILLNNRNLEKSQISDYFSILKEKIHFNKGYQIPEIVNKPFGVEKNYKVASNMKKEENFNDKPLNLIDKNGKYSGEIYELFKKNNEEIDKFVYRERKNVGTNEAEINVNDFIEEITQKYR